MMYNNEIFNNGSRSYFDEMAGFKIVMFLATHVKKALKYVISKYAIWKNIAYGTFIQCKYMGTISKYKK